MGLMLSTENITPSEESLCEVVYNIVAHIPRGRVLTYGAIARLAGFPNHSRLGRLAPHYPAQATLLEAEGVILSPTGKVPLKTYLWQID